MSTARWFFAVAALILVAVVALAVAYPFDGGDDDVERPLALEDAERDDAVTFELHEVGESDYFGYATLAPAGGSGTRIGIELNRPVNIPMPAALHRGTCAEIGRRLHGLDPVKQETAFLGMSTTSVDAELPRLLEDGAAIVVREAAGRRGPPVACGDLSERAT